MSQFGAPPATTVAAAPPRMSFSLNSASQGSAIGNAARSGVPPAPAILTSVGANGMPPSVTGGMVQTGMGLVPGAPSMGLAGSQGQAPSLLGAQGGVAAGAGAAGAPNPAMLQMMLGMMGGANPVMGQKRQPPPAPDPSLPPSQTLYANNMSDKISIDQLKKELRAMFSNFGTVVDIIAMKSFWRRGQAWILFETQEAATKALKGLQNFPYHSKPMRLNYAISKSDIFAKADGTFVERPKGPKKPRSIVEREAKLQQQIKSMLKQQSSSYAEGATATEAPITNPASQEVKAEEGAAVVAPPVVSAAAAQAQAAEMARKHAANPATAAFTAPILPKPSAPSLPNKTLFVEGLPEGATDMMLQILFQQHAGFKEIRLIAGRQVAFVEYEAEYQAGSAMNALQGLEVASGSNMRISYARK